MNELKPIPGLENYTVDEYGNVFSLFYNKYNKAHRSKFGYMMVGLSINKKVVNHLIHRLVALAFIPNPENKRCVDHIDYNRQNNHVSNLRWATHKENKIHSTPRIQGMLNKNHSPVLHTEYGVFFTVKEAAFIAGQMPQNMSHILNPNHPAKNKTKFIYAK